MPINPQDYKTQEEYEKALQDEITAKAAEEEQRKMFLQQVQKDFSTALWTYISEHMTVAKANATVLATKGTTEVEVLRSVGVRALAEFILALPEIINEELSEAYKTKEDK